MDLSVELKALMEIKASIEKDLKKVDRGPFGTVQRRTLNESLQDVEDRIATLRKLAPESVKVAAAGVDANIPSRLITPAELDRNFGPIKPVQDKNAYIQRLRHDFIFFCQEALTIKYRPGITKSDLTRGPLILSRAQLMVAAILLSGLTEDIFISAIILKARQLGITTVLEAFNLWQLMTVDGFHYMLIIDKDDHMYTKRDIMVEWINEVHTRFPDEFPSIKKREGRVIFLTNGSQLHFESAQAGNPGTSEMMRSLHLSEQTKWPAGRAASVGQSVVPAIPKKGGYFVINESTPLGVDDFYRQYQRAARRQSNDLPIFLPWYLSEEYYVSPDVFFSFKNDDTELQDVFFDESVNREVTLNEEQYALRYRLTKGQVLWRRDKIKTDFKGKRSEFDKEYPTTAEHAWRGSMAGFFPNELRMRLASFRRPPLWQGHVSCYNPDVERPRGFSEYTPTFVEDTVSPTVKLYARPIPGSRYYLGGDVAEGKTLLDDENQPDRDSTVFRIVDDDGVLVASFESKEPAEHCWLPMVLLAIYYNLAWVNCEKNGPGKTLWAFFKLTRYPHNLVETGDAPLDDLVWTRVTQANRLTILQMLRALLLGAPHAAPDEEFHTQAEYFGQKPGGRVAAPQGQGRHDDHIFAAAHAETMRLRFRGETIVRAPIVDPIPAPPRPEGLTLSDLVDALTGEEIEWATI